MRPLAIAAALASSVGAGTLLFSSRVSAADAPKLIAAASHPPPYKIALSNSYIGNTWRVEMVNEFKAACAMEPLKSVATCTEYSSGNDVSKQTAQIDDLISSKVDAIVVNAASPTGLNGVISQACSAGILIVSFDAVATNPCGIKVNTDQIEFGRKGAQFLVDALHGKGNIIEVTGVAGTGVDQDRNKGAEEVFAKYPDIKVIAKYSGKWASDEAQRATVQQLPSLGKIDGIWCQGGTDGVIRALLDAKRPFPIPVVGEAENAFRQYMIEYKDKGFKALSIGQPPFLGILSLYLASEVLQGKHAKTDVTIPFPSVTQDTVKEGLTTFKDLPGSYFVDFTDSGPNASVIVCKDAVLHGTPCPGTLAVRL
jgi:ribose transport system substrate-binding protein